MHAIVTLLEPAIYARVEAIWRVLELKCGLKGIKATPFPHFSWQVADDYGFPGLENELQVFADTAEPFSVRTTGIGVFSGPDPVIYILIVKDRTLTRFHKNVWDLSLPFAREPAEFYSPDTWVPHVTLAHTDVNRETLSCAMEELAFVPFNWEIKIENLAIVSRIGNEIGHLHRRFNFHVTEKQTQAHQT